MPRGWLPARAHCGCYKCSCHVSAHVLPEPLCCLSAAPASRPSITILLLSFPSLRCLSLQDSQIPPRSLLNTVLFEMIANDFIWIVKKTTRLCFAVFACGQTVPRGPCNRTHEEHPEVGYWRVTGFKRKDCCNNNSTYRHFDVRDRLFCPNTDTMPFQVSRLQWFSCGATTYGSVGTSGCSALPRALQLMRCQRCRAAVCAALRQESAWKNHPPVANRERELHQAQWSGVLLMWRGTERTSHTAMLVPLRVSERCEGCRGCNATTAVNSSRASPWCWDSMSFWRWVAFQEALH